MQPYVGVVIVNYNGATFQNECVRSLIDSDYANMRIIVVDNASRDNSMQLLKEIADERLISIYNNHNGGVAQGNNIGIRKALELGCEYVLLLNNDTVLTKGFLNTLVSEREALAVPKIYFYEGEHVLWYGGGKFLNRKGSAIHLNYRCKDEKIVYEKYYEYAPTCCVLIKKEVFEKIGLMDEKYFLYYDDTDFMYRAKQAGYRIRFYEDSVIYHKVSLSTGGEHSPVSLYYGNRNRFYYINKFKLGFRARFFTSVTRKIKIVCSKLKKTCDWKYIKEAINDYKQGKFYVKEDLKEVEAKYR